MAQQARSLVHEPDDLSLSPRTQRKDEAENQLLKEVFWPLTHMLCLECPNNNNNNGKII